MENVEDKYNLGLIAQLVEGARKDLEVLVRAEALLRIIKLAVSDHKDSFAANKFLVQGSWKDPETPKRGAPSKEEIAAEAARLAKIERQIEEDFERINAEN